MTYQVNADFGTLHTRCAGQVTLDEVLAHFDELAADDTLPSGLDLLLDLSAQETAPDGPQIRQLANRIATIRGDLTWGRCAVVVSRDLLFGIARMFATYAEGAFSDMRVFRDLEEGRRWLEEGHDRG